MQWARGLTDELTHFKRMNQTKLIKGPSDRYFCIRNIAIIFISISVYVKELLEVHVDGLLTRNSLIQQQNTAICDLNWWMLLSANQKCWHCLLCTTQRSQVHFFCRSITGQTLQTSSDNYVSASNQRQMRQNLFRARRNTCVLQPGRKTKVVVTATWPQLQTDTSCTKTRSHLPATGSKTTADWRFTVHEPEGHSHFWDELHESTVSFSGE